MVGEINYGMGKQYVTMDSTYEIATEKVYENHAALISTDRIEGGK